MYITAHLLEDYYELRNEKQLRLWSIYIKIRCRKYQSGVNINKSGKIESNFGIKVLQEISTSCIKATGQYRQHNWIKGPLRLFGEIWIKWSKGPLRLYTDWPYKHQGQNEEFIDFSGVDSGLHEQKPFSREGSVSLVNDILVFHKLTSFGRNTNILWVNQCVCIEKEHPGSCDLILLSLLSICKKKRQVFGKNLFIT